MTRANERDLVIDQLHELFYLDKKGILRAKVSAGKRSKDSVVGTVQSEGYRQTTIDGNKYYVHRIVLAMELGYFPTVVDHDNGVRTDNRLNNLVECSYSYNSKKRFMECCKWISKRRLFKVWRKSNPRAFRLFENCDDAIEQHIVYNG